MPSARVIPQSLFLTDTDPHLESPDPPSDPKMTNPLDIGDPDLIDSIVNDSLGFTDDNAGLDSDPDEPPFTGEMPFDAAAVDTALSS